MELEGRRVAVLAEDVYEEMELWYPKMRLTEAGAEVRVVGPEAGAAYTSKHGLPVTAYSPLGGPGAHYHGNKPFFVAKIF